MSEPGSRDPDYLAHRETCEECARYADGVDALDRKIGDALRVPVPEDLATRIKLRQIMWDEQDTRRFRPWQYAVAASVFLVVAVSGMLGYQVYATNQFIERLSVVAVDHTRMERQGGHFVAAHDDPELQKQRFKQVLAAFGGKVMDDGLAELGEIEDVQVCPFAVFGGPAAHFVIKGQEGMVSIYYVSGNKLRRPENFSRQQYEGMLVPVGRGNMAILGDLGEPLQQIADKLGRTVAWEI